MEPIKLGSDAEEMAVQKIGVVAFPGQQRSLVNLDEAGGLEAAGVGQVGRPVGLAGGAVAHLQFEDLVGFAGVAQKSQY